MLDKLKTEFSDHDGMVCEVETVAAAADESDRIAFYERNGMRHTPLQCTLFGVEYSILYLPLHSKLTDRELEAQLGRIYCTMLPRELYRTRLWLRMGE